MVGVLLAALLACNGDDAPGPAGGDSGLTSGLEDCETSPIRYDTFAQPLLATWCTPCHSSELGPSERSGAPEGLDFDTYTRVVTYAELASASITQERMPPAGGLSTYDREAFAAWVACGMPEGDPIDPSQAMCEAPVLVDADALDCTNADQQLGVDVEGTLAATGELPCVCSVQGDLVPAGDSELRNLARVDGAVELGAGTVHLPALQEAGSLRLHGAIQGVGLDGLEHVRGNVVIEGTALSRVELPRLDIVEGDLAVTHNAQLTDGARFANVTVLEGSFRFVDNDAFPAQVLFGHLEQLDGDIDIQGNDALVSIVGLDHLPQLGGRLQIQENPELELINLGIDLERIGHGLVIIGNASLTNIETFPLLTSIGMDGAPDPTDPGTTDVFLIANTSLLAFTALPALTEVGGLYVASHLRLASLGEMPQLTTVAHDVVLENTRQLGAPPSVPALAAVGGDLRLVGNLSIDTLAPLAGISAIGGDLVFVDNAALPAGFVQTFVEGVTVGGATTVSGNGP